MSKFDRNIPYNDLPLLTASNDVFDDKEILKKLVTASRALANVNGNINRLPNPFMLINTIALQEAKSSTEIENIFTTEDELYKAISEKDYKGKIDAATKEVLKYREALWSGFSRLKDSQKIEKKLIITIFNQIKETTQEFRSPQAKVVIRKGSSEFKSGEIVYTPPRGEKKIEELIENLLEFLNNDKKYPIDPLLKMCVGHYQFEAIHPFQDENGRTGRILNILYLINKGLLSHPILYLSKYIIINKDDYYFKLTAVTQRNSWKQWIAFMLDAIEKTSILTNTLINEILDQMESTLNYAKDRIKWYNKEVNEILFSQPYIKQNVLGQILDKSSRTTLTKYFDELEKYKILRPKKSGKEVFYINDDLIRILES